MTKKKNDISLTEVLKMYNDDLMSAKEIAEHFGTYPNKILRMLNKSGQKKRDRSEAQKMAIERGRKAPPNDGSPLSEERKMAISEGMAEFWKNAPDEYVEEHSKRAKEQWDNMSDSEKQEMHRKARQGILTAAKEGSKVEVAIREALDEAGISYLRNHKGFLIDPDLEVDIFIPAHSAAIEVDGIFHNEAIHGEAKLLKRKQTDRKKDGLLKREGYWPIRVKIDKKTVSKKDYRDVCQKVLSTLDGLSGTPKLITIKIN